MGVDLVSVKHRKEASFNWTAWRFLLDTAKDHGWAPMGTILDFSYQYRSAKKNKRLDEISKKRLKLNIQEYCEGWPGDYASNENQMVVEEDARNILKALTKAMNNRDFGRQIAADQKDVLIEFMEFLKYGSFRIG